MKLTNVGGREDNGLKRKLVHGRVIVFHLDHPIQSRHQLNTNDERLKDVLKNKSIRCDLGIMTD